MHREVVVQVGSRRQEHQEAGSRRPEQQEVGSRRPEEERDASTWSSSKNNMRYR